MAQYLTIETLFIFLLVIFCFFVIFYPRRMRAIVTTWFYNLLYISTYLLSLSHYIFHVGRRIPWFHGSFYSNWSASIFGFTKNYKEPKSEEELSQIVKKYSKVRVVGSAYSFNNSWNSLECLVSLKKMNGVTFEDETFKIKVGAGLRIGQVNQLLKKKGWTLSIPGSTDLQTIGGLVATDLHGSGRDYGFLSEHIVSLRIMDANGHAKNYYPGDPFFHASIGSIGIVGITTQVELQCEKSCHLEKTLKILPRNLVEPNIEELLEKYDHVSLYYISGEYIQDVRLNIWRRTTQKREFLAKLWRGWIEVMEFFFSGFFLGLAKVLGLARAISILSVWVQKLTMQVKTVDYFESAYCRKLFFRHDEIEYGIPLESFYSCIQEVMNYLYEKRFVSIVEVRFTPNHSQGILGAGSGRRTCYMELAPSLSFDPHYKEEIFKGFETILLKYKPQPHLGKNIVSFNHLQMKEVFGEKLNQVLELSYQQDPLRKFRTDFTNRIFGES